MYQCVVINDFESEWDGIEAGIQSNVKFFADDTSLFYIVTIPILSTSELNSDFKYIAKWAHQWKMSFNPDPTKQLNKMLFSQKIIHEPHPPIFFNSLPLVSATDHKHVGLILDCKLSFSKHLSEEIANARKGISIIRHLSSHVPLNILDQLNKMFLRPYLDYCDIIYHIPTVANPFDSFICLNYSMASIERTQYHGIITTAGS